MLSFSTVCFVQSSHRKMRKKAKKVKFYSRTVFETKKNSYITYLNLKVTPVVWVKILQES